MFGTTLVLAAVALTGVHHARAQITSNATCLTQFSGLYNSKGQGPCLVASYLAGACNGGQYDVSTLLPGQHYVGPQSGLQATPCLCSTVVYSLMGGCSACQNATIVSWASWSANCSSVYFDTFPQDIPSDTIVPGWAYENVTNTGGTFNPTNALSDHSPESTATQTKATQTGGSQTSTFTPTGTSTNTGGRTNVGAIAGGVVGGVVGAAIIGLGLVFFVRGRRNRRNAKVGLGTGGMPPGAGSMSPLMMGGEKIADHSPITATYPQQRLYDPNDPSTFPTSPNNTGINAQWTGQTYTNQPGYPSQPVPQFPSQPLPHATGDYSTGTYRGVAEI